MSQANTEKTKRKTVHVGCVECGAESDILEERLNRARCDVEMDEGEECGGMLAEVELDEERDRRALIRKLDLAIQDASNKADGWSQKQIEYVINAIITAQDIKDGD